MYKCRKPSIRCPWRPRHEIPTAAGIWNAPSSRLLNGPALTFFIFLPDIQPPHPTPFFFFYQHSSPIILAQSRQPFQRKIWERYCLSCCQKKKSKLTSNPPVFPSRSAPHTSARKTHVSCFSFLPPVFLSVVLSVRHLAGWFTTSLSTGAFPFLFSFSAEDGNTGVRISQIVVV